jgi:hypothetical protein
MQWQMGPKLLSIYKTNLIDFEPLKIEIFPMF